VSEADTGTYGHIHIRYPLSIKQLSSKQRARQKGKGVTTHFPLQLLAATEATKTTKSQSQSQELPGDTSALDFNTTQHAPAATGHHHHSALLRGCTGS
jgi:hypothetical protein